ncbi:MAG TPA: fused MFS/spermidine synthase [Desulfuromonadaceae bacterium]|jgi:predicted membrane-bound spermidine synthase
MNFSSNGIWTWVNSIYYPGKSRTAEKTYARTETGCFSSCHLYYLLFALSGFSALIYESIWSHYMKLYLGHSAYAQSLVLSIFMAGMAIGSGICGKYSSGWKKLFLGYALAEGLIGILALIFHDVFNTVTEFSHTALIYHLDNPHAAYAFKWLVSAILILPQSILIGMPFPLMSAAIIRVNPSKQGKTISMLYFTNSLGAAIGVLTSGFLLIKIFGLPGTIRVAGFINIALAVTVWLLAGGLNHENSPCTASDIRCHPDKTDWFWKLLFASFLTGLASFIYEIGWIRMLNLVMGSSTHAFELMLSAFILGLALGALWIQRRMDSITNPVRFLVLMQIIMGLFALATLPVYGNTFTVMQWLLENLSKTETGYLLFNVYSHALALAVMLPTTFCAGCTLPLITFALIKKGYGEKSIGAVYAVNTVGAIFGALFAIHLGMPFLGLKGLIMLGGSLDIGLGLFILWMLSTTAKGRYKAAALTAVCLAGVLATEFLVTLDPYKMASGVYRNGKFLNPDTGKLMYHQDGKTATVSLTLGKTGYMSIRTNGKPDASINIANNQSSPDESTMVLAAVIPMGLHPQARTIANIGLGSGLTAHTFLSNPFLQQVDTIEIEPKMVEAANRFGSRVNLAFNDPRSKINIDDAKTFFSTHKNKYDIIVSEPSNPWVSGVGGLFSEEFYRMINRNLNTNGIFVQWLQLYETDSNLVVSILKTISPYFYDFVVYAPNDYEIFIVARKDGAVGKMSAGIYKIPAITSAMKYVYMNNIQDVELRKIVDKKTYSRFLETFAVRTNSDFYPILDQNAARARFMQANASKMLVFSHDPLPTSEMLTGSNPEWQQTNITPSPYSQLSKTAFGAMACRDYFLTGNFSPQYRHVPAETRQDAERIKQLFQGNNQHMEIDKRIEALLILARFVPYLRPQEMGSVLSKLESLPGYAKFSAQEKIMVRLIKAAGNRDATAMADSAVLLLNHTRITDLEALEYTLASGMLGYLVQGKNSQANRLWQDYGYKVINSNMPEMLFRLLAANSI